MDNDNNNFKESEHKAEFSNTNSYDNAGSNANSAVKKRNIKAIIDARSFRFSWVFFLIFVLCATLPIGFLERGIGVLNAQALVRLIFSIGIIVFLFFYNKCSFFKVNKLHLKYIDLIFCAIAIAIFNFPIFALGMGDATITGATGRGHVASYIFWTLSVSLIEELVFRGIIFTLLLVTFKKEKHRVIYAVLLSSAMFGIVHLLNLFSMPAPAVLMQVGYTFLLGMLWAIIFYFTKSLVPVIVAHALFNTGGFLLSQYGFGRGYHWNGVAIGVFVAVCVLAGLWSAFRLVRYLRTTPEYLKSNNAKTEQACGEAEIDANELRELDCVDTDVDVDAKIEYLQDNLNNESDNEFID